MRAVVVVGGAPLGGGRGGLPLLEDKNLLLSSITSCELGKNIPRHSGRLLRIRPKRLIAVKLSFSSRQYSSTCTVV